MTLRLPRDLWGVYRQPPQFRFGTVTSVSPGICTVQVAGGEIPVIYFKNTAPSVGDFVSVQRQSVVSYLMTAPSGALWASDDRTSGGLWRIPTSGADAVFYPVANVAVFAAVAAGTYMWACGVGPNNGHVIRMAASGPSIGTFAEVTLPAAYPQGLCIGPDGNTWVADSDGYVWAVTPDMVVLEPYLLSGSAPYGIVAGPDGNIWVADNNGGVWRVTTGGAGTFFGLPNSSPTAICAYNGALWVADANNAAWRVSVDGAATYYLLTEGNSDPAAITPGPDGRLWVAGATGPGSYVQVASLSAPLPAGVPFTSIPTTPLTQDVPGPTSGFEIQLGVGQTFAVDVQEATSAGATSIPLDLSTTPYTTWPVGTPVALVPSTSTAGTAIAATTSGSASVYALPTPAGGHLALVYGVAAGSDGNMWLSDYYAAVFKVSTDGAATYYALPDSTAQLNAITPGP